jgi:hypothetical protein
VTKELWFLGGFAFGVVILGLIMIFWLGSLAVGGGV